MSEVAEKIEDIYTFIISEEENYRTERVPLASNWRDWNMYEHIDRSFLLKNSKFYLGNQDYRRPFNNIILPIANVNYRSEGFDVKDVQMFVDNPDHFHRSFVARKFHNWWGKENKIDEAIDDSVVSYFDYGLILLKNVNEAKPEVVQLQQIAFCDQTDIMSGPICLKHHYSIPDLLEMKGKWDSNKVDNVILQAKTKKEVDQANDDKAETPGKYVEVYELHGTFPESWLGAEKLGEDWEDTGKYSPQVHIVSYYISPIDGKSKVGVTLFKGEEKEPIFKAHKRDPIHGRACGRGGIEELFHPQIWTNYSELHIAQMLETVSKVVLTTNKKKVAQINNFSNIKQGQVIDLDGDGTLNQLQLQPINKQVFDFHINKWEQIARTIGGSPDTNLGQEPKSGTPLGTVEILAAQGQGVHQYRQGQIAAFWQEVYRDWVLPHLQKEIRKGHKWLDELSIDEVEEIAEKVANNRANDRVKDMVLAGKPVTEEGRNIFKELVKDTFRKKGEKHFLEALKDEFKDLPMDIEISIVGQKANLAEMVSKLNSVFRTLFTPGAIQSVQQNPELGKLLNEILEASGLSPIAYGRFKAEATTPDLPQPAQNPSQNPLPQLTQ